MEDSNYITLLRNPLFLAVTKVISYSNISRKKIIIQRPEITWPKLC